MLEFIRKIARKLIYSEIEIDLKNYLLRTAKGYTRSYVVSLHDEPYSPSKRLLDLAIRFIVCANNDIDVSPVSRTFSKEIEKNINTWPGDRYRLLAGIVKVLQPKLIIEIGTAAGASCLCMKKYLPKGSKLVTFDIMPWKEYP